MQFVVLQSVRKISRRQLGLLQKEIAEQIRPILIVFVHFEYLCRNAKGVDYVCDKRLRSGNVTHSARFGDIEVDARNVDGIESTAYAIVRFEQKNAFRVEGAHVTEAPGQVGSSRTAADNHDVLDTSHGRAVAIVLSDERLETIYYVVGFLFHGAGDFVVGFGDCCFELA